MNVRRRVLFPLLLALGVMPEAIGQNDDTASKMRVSAQELIGGVDERRRGKLVLREMEFAMALMRDPEKYSIVFFGQPAADSPWGWRFEGHHLSLSFTL